MLLTTYITFAAGIALLTGAARSQRTMTTLAVLHSFAVVALAGYAASLDLPVHYISSDFYVDALSVYEIAISGIIFALAAFYSGGYLRSLVSAKLLDERNIRFFYSAFNILQAVCVMSFVSNNLAIFWIFAELTTFFSAALIAILNSKKNIDASIKYVFMMSTAMLFTFMGMILMFALTEHALGTGTLNWDELMEYSGRLSPALLTMSYVFIFIGYAAKAGIAPFHTALPHAYSKAPSAVSTIISAVMLNLGIYGILRMYAIVKQTPAAEAVSMLMVAFGALSLGIAAFSMLKERNIKKLVAYSSVEHAGLMLIGIGIGTPAAIFWVLYHMLAHSLAKALLFLSAGILHRQYLSSKVENIKNAFGMQPVASAGLIVGGTVIAGMPPFLIFTTKLGLLAQVAGYSEILLAIVLLLVMTAAAAFAIQLSAAFSNIGGEDMRRYDTPRRMRIPIILLIAAILALSLAPDMLYAMVLQTVAALGF